MLFMKNAFLFLIFALSAIGSQAQNLYSKSFGEKQNPALIYLHGGPGYNCSNFEVSTANTLAKAGFYVIVYDRRGEGRSEDAAAAYTFEQTLQDLNALYEQYHLEKATLLGHSFGGMVGIKYAAQFPKRVKNLVLIGAPISLQESFKTILATVKPIYLAKEDKTNLNYIAMLENMDSSSLQYSSYCFMHAMQNGFYSPANSNPKATELYALFKTDSILKNYGAKMGYAAPQGFWKNEQYTTLDMTAELQKTLKQGTAVYGLYGKEDGLYSEKQVLDLQALLGAENLLYLENCSHNVYIDRQVAFIQFIEKVER